MNNCKKVKILPLTNLIVEVRQMKIVHLVLICLVVFAFFSCTAVAFRPQIQQVSDLVPWEKTLCNSMKSSHKGKPDLVELGDPIEDPIPHKI